MIELIRYDVYMDTVVCHVYDYSRSVTRTLTVRGCEKQLAQHWRRASILADRCVTMQVTRQEGVGYFCDELNKRVVFLCSTL
jgi:hypothetical protein